MKELLPAFLILLAYLIGAIPFGLLGAKLFKSIDIREHGSGNIGATNVFRVCGKELGITVFVLDVLKGLIPVLLTKSFASDPYPIFAGVAAIVGHNFPVWLKFKGGKGIATSAGVLGGLLPWALLIALVTWIASFVLTRYVSVASILAAVSLPITEGFSRPFHSSYFAFTVVIALLAIWRHRSNLKRLRDGTEDRFVRKKDRIDSSQS